MNDEFREKRVGAADSKDFTAPSREKSKNMKEKIRILSFISEF